MYELLPICLTVETVELLNLALHSFGNNTHNGLLCKLFHSREYPSGITREGELGYKFAATTGAYI